VSTLLSAILGTLVATNTPAAISNFVEKTTGFSVPVRNLNDPAARELAMLEQQDDAAMEEIDRWITDNRRFAAEGAGLSDEELNRKILARLDVVRRAYEDFLTRHPDHAEAHVAYASFLADIGDEEGEVQHLEKAARINPDIPAVWNNLANHFGHRGPVKRAFACYEKAIAPNPNEPIYYHNFGTTVYLFRKDAREYFSINEQQVFDKAFELYSNAMRLDPSNFLLASDIAQTYYGIKPLRTNDALLAWTNAMALASDDIEREGVHIHFARIKLGIGRFDEARAHLDAVSNPIYADLKRRLLRNLNEKEYGTNPPPVEPAKTAVEPPPARGVD